MPFGGLDEYTGAQTPLPRPSNVPIVFSGPSDVPTAAFVGSEAPPRVYSNEKVQDIIQTVIETKPAAIKDPQKCLQKAWLPDVYRSNNHMACYNFCQQCEDYFTTARAKRPDCIPFAAFFFQNSIGFC